MASTKDDIVNKESFDMGVEDSKNGVGPIRYESAGSPDFYRLGYEDEETAAKSLPRELAALLNKYSAENVSGTPDFVLAEVALDALKSFNENVHKRGEWRGETVEFKPGAVAKPLLDSSVVDEIVNTVSHEHIEAQEKYIRGLMQALGLTEADLKDYILESYPPEYETTGDAFTNAYSIRFSSKFRFRRKTDAEKAAEEYLVEVNSIEELRELEGLFDRIMDTYGCITVSDIKSAQGIRVDFKDSQWGWKDLTTIQSFAKNGSWFLKFPVPERL